jgi:hypothetical protein
VPARSAGRVDRALIYHLGAGVVIVAACVLISRAIRPQTFLEARSVAVFLAPTVAIQFVQDQGVTTAVRNVAVEGKNFCSAGKHWLGPESYICLASQTACVSITAMTVAAEVGEAESARRGFRALRWLPVRERASPAAQTMSLAIPSDWTVSNGSGQFSPLSLNGSGSLSVNGTGWVTITSVPLSAADLRASAGPDLSSVAYDLYIPLPQPNPSWIGATQMYLSAPSAGIYNAYLGQDELTGQPEQQFVTERFSVPTYAMPALTGTAKDVTLTIVLNANNGTLPWLLSAVRFGGL